jgi:hypothetical protein
MAARPVNGKDCEGMNETRKSVSSRADFIRWAGIGPELAEFVDTFIDKPEIFFSMSSTQRREIENRMDAILSAIGQ